MTTDVHNLGNFASLAAAWERYPNGAMVGDYIFIAGVRYDWDKYEKQWLTPVAVTDMNISVFDVSTYDFEANDWRHALPNGEYTVVSNTQAVGKLLKYDDGFVLEGFVTLAEAGADKVFSPSSIWGMAIYRALRTATFSPPRQEKNSNAIPEG